MHWKDTRMLFCYGRARPARQMWKASLKRSWCKRSSSWCRTHPWKYPGGLQGQSEPRHPTQSTSPHCLSPQVCWIWAEAAETTPCPWPGSHQETAWRGMLSWQSQSHTKNIHKSLFAKAFPCTWCFGPQRAKCVVYSMVLLGRTCGGSSEQAQSWEKGSTLVWDWLHGEDHKDSPLMGSREKPFTFKEHKM